MDFILTAEQANYAAHVQDFSERVLSASAAERMAESRFDREIWRQAAEMGLAGLPVPEEWGGSGFGALDTMVVVEAMGRGCEDMGLVFSLCAHMFACAVPVWRYGSDAIRERFLRGVATGELIAANAITEPRAGSDVHAMGATATRDGDQYVLNGEKCFVTNAPVADLFLVYAKTTPAYGFFGTSGFLIPRDTHGLMVADGGSKTGLDTSPWGTVYLDQCQVPLSALVGAEGGGATMFKDSMVWERGCLFAAYVGAMERVLERCVEQARNRKQFGKSIGSNQAISHRLVDMKLRVDTSRLLLYRAGWLYDRQQPCEEAIAMSKLWISECAVQSGLDAIQIFGGTGVSSSAGIDRLLLDALPSRIFSGTSEVQRDIISRHLGLR
jgi:alkylation response protein AidB-like acyl-CoA dehydrogenase